MNSTVTTVESFRFLGATISQDLKWDNHIESIVKKARQRVVRTAERIIGTTLPSLQELYLSRVSKRAGKITLDPSHPAHSLFEHQNDQTQEQFLPSGNPPHEHLKIIVEHTLFIHLYT